MKKILFFLIVCLSLTDLFAQKETFDLFAFTPPAGWKKDVTENIISYTRINNKNKSWCRIGIVKSTISKGNIEADFESEWQDLIVKNYNPTEAPVLNEVSETDGWKVKDGVAKFKFNNADAQAMLTTISGFDRCASIIITINNQEYLEDIDTFLKSVEFKKMETAAQPPVAENNTDDASIIGTWDISASDQSSYRMNNGVMNYIVRQYTFNENGTYSFVTKTFDPFMDKLLLGKENGTYLISGTNLTITPEKSVLEAWSKKDGNDEWGKFLSSQDIELETVIYQFTKNYFSGIKEWSLVLKSDKQTQRDGPYSGIADFSNSWIYSPPCSQCFIVLPAGQQVITEEKKNFPAAQTPFSGYAYTTTSFDDGWVATEKEDWVQLTKGNINVLLHYAKEGTTIAADPEPHITNAWNILVAPRYSNLKNFKVASPSLDPQRAYLGAGDITENKTGKQVYVALFRKGSSGWVEFIAPDKNTFVKEFGADVDDIGWDASSNIWNPLLKMFNYNKFAVSAGDLPGNWKSSSGAGIEYYNVYTGNNLGLASASSTTEFIFQQDGTYTSIYKGVDGFNGNNRYAGEKCNGKAIVSNWQIQLTNRFNGATETFTSQFEAVKGGRILHMYRGNIEELHLFRMR